MKFQLTYNSGDECAAVLSGLQMYITERQRAMDRMDQFMEAFDKVHDTTLGTNLITIRRQDLLAGINEPEELINELMYWTAEKMVPDDDIDEHGGITQEDIDNAVIALKGLRDYGAQKVELTSSAATAIYIQAHLAFLTYSDEKEEAKKVLARAEAQLPEVVYH